VKDARQTFLGIWIRNIIEGKPVLVFGDGKQIRDFNYVDDVVSAMIACAISDDANGEVFNLGADDPINLKDTAELLLKIYDKGEYRVVPFPPDRKVIDIGDYYADYRKIRSKLGWRPEVPLAEGLRRSLCYFEAHAVHYWEKNEPSNV